jgi:uncharacterized membrane protein
MPFDFRNQTAEMSMGERAASVVGGLALAAAGTKPRPNMLLNVAALALGSYLAYRGATGHCPVKRALLGTRQG